MEAGAHRVELCSVWSVGGITPNVVAVEAAAAMGMPVRALIRPREGSFVHSASERSWAVEEAKVMMDCGAERVVVGALVTPTTRYGGAKRFAAPAKNRGIRHIAGVPDPGPRRCGTGRGAWTGGVSGGRAGRRSRVIRITSPPARRTGKAGTRLFGIVSN